MAGADTLRSRQLATLLAHPAWTQPADLRLLCGDFNTTADGPVLGPYLRGEKRICLADTYAVGVGPEPHGTLSDNPTRCIDHILALPAESSVVAVPEARVVPNRPCPETGVYPSDHVGVLAGFERLGSPAQAREATAVEPAVSRS